MGMIDLQQQRHRLALLVAFTLLFVTTYFATTPLTDSPWLLRSRRTKSRERFLGLTSSPLDDHCPPLADLIGDNKTTIIGDVQFLLDFAIIGHAKTGTSEQVRWIAKHEEVQMYDHEVYSLKDGKPAELVKLMYELPEGNQYKRGYKAPRDIINDCSRDALQKYWPKTKLIVGVRHPVLWFQSWYNHMTKGYHPPCHDVGPALSFVSGKLPQDVFFHQNLAMLGKTTPLDNPVESSLLGWSKEMAAKISCLPNPVFLYDISQPFNENRTIGMKYAEDLSNYIGLKRPLRTEKYSPEVHDHHNRTIDICDEGFIELRQKLVIVGKVSSKWLQHYFMDLPDVTVSSPDNFKEILKTWSVDPCKEANE